MAESINVSPENSPYQVPSPTAEYDNVTIEPGGLLQFSEATTMMVANLVKDDTETE